MPKKIDEFNSKKQSKSLDKKLRFISFTMATVAVAMYVTTYKMYLLYTAMQHWTSISEESFPAFLKFFRSAFLVTLPCVATGCLVVCFAILVNIKRRSE